MGICKHMTHCTPFIGVQFGYTYILAWVSALLVRLKWAMREPRSVERVMVKESHASFIYRASKYFLIFDQERDLDDRMFELP